MPKSASSGERDPEDVPDRLPPARSRERRVEQLYTLAEELVEERLRKGTASPTEVAAILRYSSPTEIANLERIKAQTAYLKAQEAKAVAETLNQEAIDEAMAAFGRYTGQNRGD